MSSSKKPRDVNQRAAFTVALATGQIADKELEVEDVVAEPTPEERHAAAITLGRKGGQARALRLSASRRSEIAKQAAEKRWRKNE